MTITIDSLENPRIKMIRKLHQAKYRKKYQAFLVEGEHLVLKASVEKALETVIIAQEKYDKYNKWLIKTNIKTEILVVSRKIFQTIVFSQTPQGILGICRIKTVKTMNENAKKALIVLENIQDPGNLGTILRSAAAFGFKQLYITANSVDQYNFKTIAASQGAIFDVKVIIIDLPTFIIAKKTAGYQICGTYLETKTLKTIEIANLNLNQKNLFLFGNEGMGLSSDLIKLIDVNFLIPMQKCVESLNLATSVSIVLYRIFSQGIIKTD